MVERSGRLDLIQRAAKRMGTIETAAPIPPPAHDTGAVAELERTPAPILEEPVLVTKDAVAEARTPAEKETVIPAAARAPAQPRTVRLKYNEVRRRGMITPDNLRSNISFEFRAIKRKLLAGVRDQT